MRCLGYVFLFVFFSGLSVFSQEKYTKHTVSKGETISEIAEQYNVKPKVIYELNPKAKKGIKYHSVLLIPTKVKKTPTSAYEIITNHPESTHEVLAKETLYGIAKSYNVSVEELYKMNPELENEGLKKGQIIKIPQKEQGNLGIEASTEKASKISKTNILPKAVASSKLDEDVKTQTDGIGYEVLPKETLYSIAKQNGITVTDLKNANPSIGDKALKMGQKIIIPVKAENNLVLATKEQVSKTEKEPSGKKQSQDIAVLVQPTNKNVAVETEATHEVLPKETKYGIAKQYGISVKELEEQNPKIVKKLPVGYVLKIRSSKTVATTIPAEEIVVAKEEVAVGENSNSDSNVAHDAAFIDQLIFKASENIGTRYRSGGTTKEGFDCSGLMCSTFGAFDIQLPRSSIEMASYGSKVDTENAQKGDLIFFRTNGRRRINHVGMVVEVVDGEIKFIHSSNHGGVIISSTKEPYYEKNLVQVNRVL